MFDFRTFFGTFFAAIGSKLTKKAYTNGLVIVTAFIICVLYLGVNDFGFSSVDKEHSYNKSLDDDGVAIEEDEELFVTIEGDDEFNLNKSSSVFDGELSFNQENLQKDTFSIDEENNNDITNEPVIELDEAEEMLVHEKETEDTNLVLQKETEDTGHFVSAAAKGISISEKDYEALLRIVEAEATSEDIQGKIMIANVVLNRVEDDGFANTVYSVIHERYNGFAQFSPIDDGRYYTVKVTDSTVEAVERALQGEVYAEGALFFVARKLASSNAVSWFDRSLNKVAEHGCHEFFDYY